MATMKKGGSPLSAQDLADIQAQLGITALQAAASGGSDPKKYQKFRAAIAKARVNAGRSRIVILGDSTSAGSGASNVFTGQWPYQFTKMAAKDYDIKYNSAFSAAFSGGNDPRVSVGSGWLFITSGDFSTGSLNNSTTTNPLTFTPAEDVDTFVIWVATHNSLGVIQYSVNGGASTQFNQNIFSLPKSYQKITVSVPKGANTISISRVSGACMVFGIEAYDSTKSDIQVINLAVLGKKASDFAVNNGSWTATNAAPAFAPCLTVIHLGANEMNQGISSATYGAHMQTLITAWGATGDVVLGIQPQPLEAWCTPEKHLEFYNVAMGLAATNNIPVIDLHKRWGLASVSNALGYLPSDVHPTSTGYADYAAAYYRELSVI